LLYIDPAEMVPPGVLAKFNIAKAISSYYPSLVRVFIDHVGSTSLWIMFHNVISDDILLIYHLLSRGSE